MLEITLYKFKKKYNSTKQPDPASGTVVQGEILRPFNLLAPSFLLSPDALGTGDVKTPEFNYIYIKDFNKYYFINDWVFDAGLWLCGCKEDIAATYKTQIGESSCYVLRAAAEWNKKVADSKALTTAEVRNIVYTDNWEWSQAFHNGGAYVVGCLNDEGYTLGAVTYYVLDGAAFRSLMAQLLKNIDVLNIDGAELSKDLQKALFNPSTYIMSAMWFPADLADYVGTPAEYLRIGWWSWYVGGKKRVLPPAPNSLQNNQSALVGNVTRVLTIPKHPLSSIKGPWLNAEPYSSYTLECIPFGVFKLNASQLMNYKYLRLSMTFDYLNGRGQLRANCSNTADGVGDDGSVINAEAQVGVPVPLAQISLDFNPGDAAVLAAATPLLSNMPSPAALTSGLRPGRTGTAAGGSTTHKSSSGRIHGGGGGSFAAVNKTF